MYALASKNEKITHLTGGFHYFCKGTKVPGVQAWNEDLHSKKTRR